MQVDRLLGAPTDGGEPRSGLWRKVDWLTLPKLVTVPAIVLAAALALAFASALWEGAACVSDTETEAQ